MKSPLEYLPEQKDERRIGFRMDESLAKQMDHAIEKAKASGKANVSMASFIASAIEFYLDALKTNHGKRKTNAFEKY